MYEFESRVRYSETDADAKLSVVGMMNYLQDCSTFHSEDSGVGLFHLEKEKKIWLLSSWQIKIYRRPSLGETITTATWPYGFKGIFGMRNFAIYDRERRPLLLADSNWFLMDTENGRPLRGTEEDLKPYGEPGERLPMEEAGRKILLPEEMVQCSSLWVMAHQIDTNHHVNNAQYVEMAREALPKPMEIGEIRAEYRKAAVLGDEIKVFAARCPGGYVVSLQDGKGAVFANVELKEKREDEGHD